MCYNVYKRVLLCLVALSLFQGLFSQETESTGLEFSIIHPNTQSQIVISKLQFYLSDITFINEEGSENFHLKEQFYLVDLQDSTSLNVKVELPSTLDYSMILFSIGVDSLTNVSGAQGGPLDPIHGMYWTWQSGHINIKLEGRAPKCPARKQKFVFHLGGYQGPFPSIQEVRLPVRKKANHKINIDLAAFFEGIDLEKTYHVMSPKPLAVTLSKHFASIFKVDL